MTSADWHAGAEGFHMPQDDDEQRTSKGYAFVEFNTPEVSTLCPLILPSCIASACRMLIRALKRCKHKDRCKINCCLFVCTP